MFDENHEEEFDYQQSVKKAFEDSHWRFNSKQLGDRTWFTLPMSAKNCPGIQLKLEVTDKGDAKIRCYLAEDTPESVREELLEVVNTLNGKYRYLTLSLDSDGDILAAYDFAFFGEDDAVIRRQACTLVILLSEIMDKCIPPIMKVIWSANEDDEDEEDEE